MDNLIIEGGRPLEGTVKISGAKNAVLPIMAAALLTEEPCRITGVPDLSDVVFMAKILRSLGAEVQFEDSTLTIHAKNIKCVGNYDLIRKMRGSICIMGPLLGRLREARVSMPGGCIIGARPVDLHLKGMRALGAKLVIDEGYISAETDQLKGCRVFLGGRAGPTVLGTANLMMAAVLAEGTTVIESAACEPEIIDLAGFLKGLGAEITGAGSPTITINGVTKLHGTDHQVIPDRIEAATYVICAAATESNVRIIGARPDHMHAVLDKLQECGAEITQEGTDLICIGGGELNPVDITTMPYSGFPTDVQAQFMALMTLIPGISIITERIFESRFMHVSELGRLGANIAIEGPSAIVKGGTGLRGAPVMASDLRASAALVIAGLAAGGSTRISRVYHLDRGYEKMDQKLRALGAKIHRVAD